MLQSFDNSAPEPANSRAEWMALLARAPLPLLEQGLADHAQSTPHWLRRPETGLMMVQGRVGGAGEKFNLGELTVTRCALRLGGATPNTPDPDRQDTPVGVAYVMGRSHRHAQLAAVADALLQTPAERPALERCLLAPLRAHVHAGQTRRHAQAQTTKVDFLTVAREASGGDDEEASA
jgi:alpha-D-ribose 1-methylphosphonate 5-triphosphate synthase subunit PhnG